MPPDDAFIVQQLRAAGAIILAKVNLSEFASGGTFSSILGYSRNPHDLARSTSGSSGGTAVAVAAGYVPIGIGTDTGGSVRGPAAAQGLVALKPTRGLLSRDGIIPLSPTLDTAGPMARHVQDLAAVLGVLEALQRVTGQDPRAALLFDPQTAGGLLAAVPGDAFIVRMSSGSSSQRLATAMRGTKGIAGISCSRKFLEMPSMWLSKGDASIFVIAWARRPMAVSEIGNGSDECPPGLCAVSFSVT
jgi:Asp-tRNA(Asn)/Glu-tRNA(Gln) amidotransferase A subunit family amidase